VSPVGPLALALVVGIAAALVWPWGPEPPLVVAVVALSGVVVATRISRRLVVALAASVAALSLGVAIGAKPAWWPRAWKSEAEHVVVGRVEGVRRGADDRERLTMELEGAVVAGSVASALHPATGRLRLVLPRGAPEGLSRGDRIILRARGVERRRLRNFGDPPRPPVDPAGVLMAGPLLVDRAPWSRRAVEALRGRIRRGLELSLDQTSQSLAVALTLGDRSLLDAEIVEAFRRTGTAHLLAVSGLHVSIFTGLAFWLAVTLLLRSPFARRWRAAVPAAVVAVCACWGYATLTGLAPPVLRAAVMASAALAAVALGRPRSAPRAICLAAAALLVLDPSLLARVGFQLSFTAVLALSALGLGSDGDGSRGTLGRLGPKLWRAALASLVASLATAPLVAHHFGQVSTVGVAVNVVAIPAMAFVVLPLCLVVAVVAAASPAAGAVLGGLAGTPITWFVETLRWVAALPGACLALGRPSLLEAVLATASVLLVARFRRRALLPAALAMVLAAGSFTARVARPRLSGRLQVTFLDVGAGDSTLVELPSGGRILVDTGPAAGSVGRPPLVVEELERTGVGRLRVLALTHGHADHASGATVLSMRPGAIDYWQPFAAAGPLPALAERRHASVVDARTLCGTRSLGPVRLDVLHPCTPGAEALGENDRSLVLRFTLGKVAILLPGDVEREGEEALLRAPPATLRADVLKLPHHGSRTSSSAPLLDAVAPTLAVASCARSRRRPLPHPEVDSRLRERGITVLSTAEVGAVRVSTDGEDLRVETVRGGRVSTTLRRFDAPPQGLHDAEP